MQLGYTFSAFSRQYFFYSLIVANFLCLHLQRHELIDLRFYKMSKLFSLIIKIKTLSKTWGSLVWKINLIAWKTKRLINLLVIWFYINGRIQSEEASLHSFLPNYFACLIFLTNNWTTWRHEICSEFSSKSWWRSS